MDDAGRRRILSRLRAASQADRQGQDRPAFLGLGELEVEEGLDQGEGRFRPLVGGRDEVPVALVLDRDGRVLRAFLLDADVEDPRVTAVQSKAMPSGPDGLGGQPATRCSSGTLTPLERNVSISSRVRVRTSTVSSASGSGSRSTPPGTSTRRTPYSRRPGASRSNCRKMSASGCPSAAGESVSRIPAPPDEDQLVPACSAGRIRACCSRPARDPIRRRGQPRSGRDWLGNVDRGQGDRRDRGGGGPRAGPSRRTGSGAGPSRGRAARPPGRSPAR